MVDLGTRIRTVRQAKGMSQEELAQAVGLTKAAISRYEAGKRSPSYSQLRRIADTLGVHVFDLMDPDGLLDKSKVLVRKSGQALSPDTVALPDELKDLAAGGPRYIYDKLTDEGKSLLLAQFSRINGAKARTRINTALDQMTPEGQSRVADYAEDILPRYRNTTSEDSARESAEWFRKAASSGEEVLAEFIRHRRQESGEQPTATPESTPVPTGGKDTTPPPDAPETLPEGTSDISSDEEIDQEFKTLLDL